MKLYGSHRSPYVQKVRTFIREKEVPCEFIEARTASAEVLALNPLSQIPSLACDNGEGVFDSCVIIEYVEGTHPEPRLIPHDLTNRIAVKRWEALCDGMAEAGRMVSHEMQEPEAKRKGEDYFRKHGSKIERGLAYIDATLVDRAFLAGAQITLADVAFAAAYAYLLHSLPQSTSSELYPRAAAHAARLFERPAFRPLVSDHA